MTWFSCTEWNDACTQSVTLSDPMNAPHGSFCETFLFHATPILMIEWLKLKIGTQLWWVLVACHSSPQGLTSISDFFNLRIFPEEALCSHCFQLLMKCPHFWPENALNSFFLAVGVILNSFVTSPSVLHHLWTSLFQFFIHAWLGFLFFGFNFVSSNCVRSCAEVGLAADGYSWRHLLGIIP